MSTQVGPIAGTAATQGGGESVKWNEPENVTLLDAIPASCSPFDGDSQSIIITGFDFSAIPDTNIIDGIQITIRCNVGNGPPP